MITYLGNWKNAHQLEILLFCIAVILVVSFIFEQKLTKKKFNKYALLVSTMYVLAVFYMTVFSRKKNEISEYNFEIFWSYKLALSDVGYLEQIVLNVLLFVPLGIIGASLIKNEKKYLYGIVLGIGGLISACIEILQYQLQCGLSELDDIISNTLGMFLGIVIWRIMLLKHKNRVY